MMKKLISLFFSCLYLLPISTAHTQTQTCLETTHYNHAIYVTKVDLTCPNIKLVGSQAEDKGLTVSEFAQKYQTTVAINANFYFKDMNPIGLVVTDGKKTSKYGDTRARTLFSCDKQNHCTIEALGKVSKPSAKWQLAIAGWQRFDSKSGKFACAESDKIGCVQKVYTDKHPRTMLGLADQGKTLYLVVVEGRQLSYAGMTLDELAEFAKTLKIEQGINLDGGGSSVMVVKGKRVNDLPVLQSKERQIANHFGVKVD